MAPECVSFLQWSATPRFDAAYVEDGTTVMMLQRKFLRMENWRIIWAGFVERQGLVLGEKLH
jgi:hypothetical protein